MSTDTPEGEKTVIGTNTGHGHVWARPDGAKMRCGGPGMCAQCSRDEAMVEAKKRRKKQSKKDKIDELLAHIKALEAQLADLETKVFVPGLKKCAKCEFSLISSTLNGCTGGITANDTPEPCPNGCGPLWRVSERDAGNDMCNRLDDISDKNKTLEAENAELKDMLRDMVEDSGGLANECGRAFRDNFEALRNRARAALNTEGEQ